MAYSLKAFSLSLSHGGLQLLKPGRAVPNNDSCLVPDIDNDTLNFYQEELKSGGFEDLAWCISTFHSRIIEDLNDTSNFTWCVVGLLLVS